MTARTAARLSLSHLITYAAPAAALALPTIPVFIYLPALYGDTLGLGLAVTGLVLLVARIFDTVTDPLIGYLSDHFGFWGARRKPWIAAGAVVAGPSLYCLLVPPADAGAGYLLMWSVALYAGWSLISVPYAAWGAELAKDYRDRTRITAWREGAALVGIVAAGIIGTSGGDATARVAVFALVLGGILFPLLLWRIPDRAEQSPFRGRTRGPSTQDYWPHAVRTLVGNRPFVRLMTAWFLNGLANGIPAALFLLYLKHVLGAGPDVQPVIIAIYFIAAIVAIPIWAALSQRIGKHRTWCAAMGLACAAFITVPMLPSGAFLAFGAVCVLTGMALGADLALPPAIQADVVAFGTLTDGTARAGMFFALWAMSTKLALALAVGTALPAVAFLGFDPNLPSEAGHHALAVTYALVPVAIKVIAIAVLWQFPLTESRMAIVQRRLDSRGQ